MIMRGEWKGAPYLLPAVLGIGAAACALDDSSKQACQTQEDCLDGFTCTSANVCESTITVGPGEETGGRDAGPDPRDAGGDRIEPIVLAADQDRPRGIAVDDSNVYWVTGGGDVVRMDKSEGELEVLAQGQGDALALALGSGNLYWTTRVPGDVRMVPAEGGDAMVIASEQDNPYGITVDDTSVYWTTYGPSDASQLLGTVMKAPLAGGEPTLLAEGERGPYGVAVDNSYVYWARHDLDSPIVRLPLAGGEPEAFTPGQHRPANLVVAGGFVYWTNFALDASPMGEVKKTVPGAGDPSDVAWDEAAPHGIAADDDYVYWTAKGLYASEDGRIERIPDTGAIVRASFGGVVRTVIADGLDGPDSIAMGQAYVYWTNEGDGTVMAAPRDYLP